LKKHLLTTTAAGGLAALMAVPAAAQDTEFGFDGFARMGVKYDDSTEDTNIDTRFQLTASFSIVSDAGLTFGGKSRLRIDNTETGDLKNYTGFNEPQIYMSTGDLTVSVGNINGVMYIPGTGSTTGLTGNGSAGVTSYMEGFTTGGPNGGLYVEYSSDTTSTTNGVNVTYAVGPMSATAIYHEDGYGANLVYSEGAFAMGVAAELKDNDDTVMSVGGSYDFGMLSLNAGLAHIEDDSASEDGTKYQLSGTYNFTDASAVTAFVASEDNDGSGADGESYGVSVSRALGAGVTAVAGWEQNAAEVATMSAGVKMSF
jgi:hypothetical protein